MFVVNRVPSVAIATAALELPRVLLCATVMLVGRQICKGLELTGGARLLLGVTFLLGSCMLFFYLFPSKASKACFKVKKFGLRTLNCAAFHVLRLQLRQIVLIHVGEVVKVAVVLCHRSQLTVLDRRLCGCLLQEFGVNVGNV